MFRVGFPGLCVVRGKDPKLAIIDKHVVVNQCPPPLWPVLVDTKENKYKGQSSYSISASVTSLSKNQLCPSLSHTGHSSHPKCGHCASSLCWV